MPGSFKRTFLKARNNVWDCEVHRRQSFCISRLFRGFRLTHQRSRVVHPHCTDDDIAEPQGQDV